MPIVSKERRRSERPTPSLRSRSKSWRSSTFLRSVMAIACFLTAAGFISATGSVSAASIPSSGWSLGPAPIIQAVGDVQTKVSCPTAVFCMGIWSASGPTNSGNKVFSWNVKSKQWKSLPFPATLSSANTSISGVTCTSSTSCLAYGTELGSQVTGGASVRIARWNGSNWSLDPQPPVFTQFESDVNGLSCASVNFCMALGEYNFANQWILAAETWNGVNWQLLLSPPPVANFSDQSLSCATPTFCAMSGVSGDSGILEVWNGLTWTPGPSDADLVDCPSATFCMAVGSSESQIWNGSTWQAVPNGNWSWSPRALRCTSSISCLLIGVSGSPGITSTFYATWNGVSWTTATSAVPVPPGEAATYLDSFSCPSSTECIATGDSSLQSLPSGGGLASPLVALYAFSPTPANSYVALGDSFSSGEGIAPYFEPSNKCHRSESGYPTEVDVPGTTQTYFSLRATPGIGWGFLACSGATSTKVLDKQLKQKADPNNSNWLPLSETTRLVTISAGGDDLGWSAVLKQCYQDLHNCQGLPYGASPTMDSWASSQLSRLQSNLVGLYQQIRSEAPNAEILVLDYPQLLPSTPSEQACANLLPLMPKYPGLGSDEQDWFRQETIKLDSTIAAAVTQAHVGAVFLDVSGAFAGHEACASGRSPNGPWINAPTIGGIHVSRSHTWYLIKLSASVRSQSFHPTQTGANEYASIINQYLTANG